MNLRFHLVSVKWWTIAEWLSKLKEIRKNKIFCYTKRNGLILFIRTRPFLFKKNPQSRVITIKFLYICIWWLLIKHECRKSMLIDICSYWYCMCGLLWAWWHDQDMMPRYCSVLSITRKRSVPSMTRIRSSLIPIRNIASASRRETWHSSPSLLCFISSEMVSVTISGSNITISSSIREAKWRREGC